jgi:hypothetical protein
VRMLTIFAKYPVVPREKFWYFNLWQFEMVSLRIAQQLLSRNYQADRSQWPRGLRRGSEAWV